MHLYQLKSMELTWPFLPTNGRAATSVTCRWVCGTLAPYLIDYHIYYKECVFLQVCLSLQKTLLITLTFNNNSILNTFRVSQWSHVVCFSGQRHCLQWTNPRSGLASERHYLLHTSCSACSKGWTTLSGYSSRPTAGMKTMIPRFKRITTVL